MISPKRHGQPCPQADRQMGAKAATLRVALATWRSGYAAACKAVYTGSIPVVAFSPVWRVSATPRTFVRIP
jgi:hypothetical protein